MSIKDVVTRIHRTYFSESFLCTHVGVDSHDDTDVYEVSTGFHLKNNHK